MKRLNCIAKGSKTNSFEVSYSFNKIHEILLGKIILLKISIWKNERIF